jgi:CRP-like cAMP-binding protein
MMMRESNNTTNRHSYLYVLGQSAGCNALHALESRLCRWLLQTRDRNDSNRLPLTQEFLSQMLGVRRTTLTLIAQDLQTAGLIRYLCGRFEIVDRNGLEAKACECYGIIRHHSEAVSPQAPS